MKSQYSYNVMLEYDVCACALQGRKYLEKIMAEVDEEEFTDSNAKALFLAVKDAYMSGMEEINFMTVLIHSKKALDDVRFGGRSYLEVTRSYSKEKLDAQDIIEVFREQSRKVKMQRLADRITEQVRDNTDSDDIMTMTQQGLTEIKQCVRDTATDPMNGAVINLGHILEQLDAEERMKNQIRTGFGTLNAAIDGFDAGSLTILSAPTGAGKSAFAMNLAYQIGMIQKIPCLYINSELSEKQMAFRWGAILAEVPHHHIRRGTFHDKVDRISAVFEQRFSKGKFYCRNMPNLRIDTALLEIRTAHAMHGIRLAIIDYIGRMDTLDAGAKDWEVLYSGARWLKTLAQELNIAIIMVAQLDKSGTSLARASYMQQEADTWLNIIRYYDDENHKDDQAWIAGHYPWNAEVEIKKSRNSEGMASVYMYFHGATLTFTDNADEAMRLRETGESGRWKTS